jgi:4-carboxymuconolactone decarboxylase
MKAIAIATFLLAASGMAVAQPAAPNQPDYGPAGPAQHRLVPGMAEYTNRVLFGDVWLRKELSPRDRSLVVVTTLIATGKSGQLQGHLTRALTNGVTPVEASGVLTHLAFYAGWPSAVSALEVFEQVYKARNIDFASLQAAVVQLPPMSGSTEANSQHPESAAKFSQLTTDVLLNDLWRRSDLHPRDRALITLAALAATGEADQFEQYIGIAKESGLTRADVTEAMTHLAFYAGWPKAQDALRAVARLYASSGNPEVERRGDAAQPNFVGKVAVGSYTNGTHGSRIRSAPVTFEVGARTNWHSHPGGQLLVVTDGSGWSQAEGEGVKAIRTGDVIWTPPNVKHWHGATRSSRMTHVAVSEFEAGVAVEWHGPVSDSHFNGPD